MKSTTKVLKTGREISRRRPANLDDRDDELFRDAYGYSTLDSRLTFFENASVSADSVIYSNYLPRVESLYRMEDAGYYRFRYLAKMLLTARTVRLDKDKYYLLATDRESGGHFHWFTEVLPRLWLVRDRANDFALILPDTTYVRTIGAASIDLLGLAFKEIVWMESGAFNKVPKLYHVSRIARTGQMDDAIMKELNREFIGEERTGDRKLYVSRARARFRKILNEEELAEALKAYGFEVVHPDDWSLEKQIAVFSECESLVSIHGAGLTNCLFMPPGGKVIELGKREPNYGYWHLAESVGHEYFYYHGIPDSESTLIGRGSNLTITVDDFENSILKKLEAA